MDQRVKRNLRCQKIKHWTRHVLKKTHLLSILRKRKMAFPCEQWSQCYIPATVGFSSCEQHSKEKLLRLQLRHSPPTATPTHHSPPPSTHPSISFREAAQVGASSLRARPSALVVSAGRMRSEQLDAHASVANEASQEALLRLTQSPEKSRVR